MIVTEMSKYRGMVHALSNHHKTETRCGRAARRVKTTLLEDQVTCGKCRPTKPRPSEPWKPEPKRCDFVVRRNGRIELCGVDDCEEH